MHTDFRKRQPWCWYELGLNGSFDLKISIHRPAYELLLQRLGREQMPARFRPAHTKYGHMVAFTMPLPSSVDAAERYAVCDQLAGVLNALCYLESAFEHKGQRQKKQLLSITYFGASSTPYSTGLECYVFPPLGHWLCSNAGAGGEFMKVKQTLVKAQMHLSAGSKYRLPLREVRYETRAKLYRNYLYLRIVGNAADLSVNGSEQAFDAEAGYKMGPHNIDSPAQLLSLLWGLARVHDLARGA